MIFYYIFFCWFLCTWVADGATHFLGTDIGNPVSGSFFPLIAGSDSGSTPSFQSIHESRTDNITLKGAKPRLTQQSSMEYFKIIYFQEGFNNCARVKMFKLIRLLVLISWYYARKCYILRRSFFFFAARRKGSRRNI